MKLHSNTHGCELTKDSYKVINLYKLNLYQSNKYIQMVFKFSFRKENTV